MLRITAFIAAMALFALPAGAGNIFLDEDFEDGTPFQNQNYPVQNDSTFVDLATINARQGVAIRSGDGGGAAAPQIAIAHSGTISTDAAWKGTNGLQLASGQFVRVDNTAGIYTGANQNNHHTFQFAVKFPPAVFSLAAGTQVAHLRQDWSTDGANTVIEQTYQLNFVRNATGGIDLIVANNAGIAGTITPDHDFSVVTVIAEKALDPNPDYGNGYFWIAWNPFTQEFIGPQPINSDPATGTVPLPNTNMATHACGIHTYLNANAASNFIPNTELGNWNETNKGSVCLIYWELVAENGGTLLVDEMYWSVGYNQNVADADRKPNAFTQEASARMNKFVVPPPPSADARDWSLYE
jgi:hypothetical protein